MKRVFTFLKTTTDDDDGDYDFLFFLFCHGGHGVMNDLESKGIHIYVWSFYFFMHSCFYIADISGIGVGLGSLKYFKPLYVFQVIYFQTFIHKDENSDRKKKSIITTTLVYIHRTSYAGIIAHNLPQSSPSTSLSNFPLWTSNLLRSRLASPGITSLSMHPLLSRYFQTSIQLVLSLHYQQFLGQTRLRPTFGICFALCCVFCHKTVTITKKDQFAAISIPSIYRWSKFKTPRKPCMLLFPYFPSSA